MAAYTTIDDPSAYFKVQLYTGDGNDSRTITFDDTDTDMQPDMIWIKERSSTSSHYLTSIGMGIGTRLEPDGAGAESTEGLSAVTSDGFTIGTSTNQVNQDTITHVAWCWKESADAGFDILEHTGTGSGRTISHNLSAVPQMMIVKATNAAEGWAVYHHKMSSAPETDYIYLHIANAVADYAGFWNDTAPTSSVFSVGDADNTNSGSGYDYINYLWTGKQGFSKFGSYVGNGNADGTFIYLGFRPAWIMFKDANNSNSWIIMDTKRDPENIMNATLYADDNVAESDTDRGDAVSNGFKCRGTSTAFNGDGRTYIYAAFAEAPFVNSNGVPCNAR